MNYIQSASGSEPAIERPEGIVLASTRSAKNTPEHTQEERAIDNLLTKQLGQYNRHAGELDIVPYMPIEMLVNRVRETEEESRLAGTNHFISLILYHGGQNKVVCRDTPAPILNLDEPILYRELERLIMTNGKNRRSCDLDPTKNLRERITEYLEKQRGNGEFLSTASGVIYGLPALEKKGNQSLVNSFAHTAKIVNEHPESNK